MDMTDHDGLIARIRQLRRRADSDRAVDSAGEPSADRLDSLEARVSHLERLLEGLQDSVHRESERHAKLIAELEAKVQPGVMGASLARDARRRGL
jgi:hypothetical protein